VPVGTNTVVTDSVLVCR